MVYLSPTQRKLLVAGLVLPAAGAAISGLPRFIEDLDSAPYASAAMENMQAGRERRAPELGSEFLVRPHPQEVRMSSDPLSVMSKLANMQEKSAAGGGVFNRFGSMLGNAGSGLMDDVGRAASSLFRPKNNPFEALELQRIEAQRALLNAQRNSRNPKRDPNVLAAQHALDNIDLDLQRARVQNPDATSPSSGARLAGTLGSGALLLGGAAALDGLTDSGYADSLGYNLNKKLSPLSDRIKLDELVASSYAQQLAKNVANMSANVVAQTGVAAGAIPGALRRTNMAEQVLEQDEMLRNATPAEKQRALQSYESMSRYAPDVATDPIAAANFMRESVVSGNGPDYATIGALGQAQKNVAGNPVTWTKGIQGAGGV